MWLIRDRRIRAPGICALYVAGYSAFRIFEELLRVDPAHHFLGERLSFWVASLLALAGIAWFTDTQRARNELSPGGLVPSEGPTSGHASPSTHLGKTSPGSMARPSGVTATSMSP